MVRTKRKDQPINPIDIQPHSKKLRQEKKHHSRKEKGNKTIRQMRINKIQKEYAHKYVLIKAWYHIHQNIFST